MIVPCFGVNSLTVFNSLIFGNLLKLFLKFIFVFFLYKVRDPPFFLGMSVRYIKKLYNLLTSSLWGLKRYPPFETEKSISKLSIGLL